MSWFFDGSDELSIMWKNQAEYQEQQERELQKGLALITKEMISQFVDFVVETKFIEGKSAGQVAEMAGLPSYEKKDGRDVFLPWDKIRFPHDRITGEGKNWWKTDISAEEFYELRPDLRPEGEIFPNDDWCYQSSEKIQRESKVAGKHLELRDFVSHRQDASDLPFFGYGPAKLEREIDIEVNVVDDDDYDELNKKLRLAGFYNVSPEDYIELPSWEERRDAQNKKEKVWAEEIKAEVDRNGYAYIPDSKKNVKYHFWNLPGYSHRDGSPKGCLVYRKDADPFLIARLHGKEITDLVSQPAEQNVKFTRTNNGIAVKYEAVEDLWLDLEKPYGNRKVAEAVILKEALLAETNEVNKDPYILDGLSQVWHFRSFEIALENCLTEALRKAGISEPAKGLKKALPELRQITGRSFTKNGKWINGEDWMRKQLSDISGLARMAGIKCRNIDAVLKAYLR